MSTKEQQVQEMTNVIAKFIAYVAKKLPDDVEAKIKELSKSTTPELIVLGDKESSLQNVMKVVDFARLAKIKKLSLQSLSQ